MTSVAAWLVCGAVLASGAAFAQTVSEEEITRADEDAREEREAPVPKALDEIVSESELEWQRKAQSRRRNTNLDVDFVTVTRNNTRTGKGSIQVRVQPYTPQREIRFRASGARQLAEGENSRLELQRDRLTTKGSLIRSVSLEFTAGMDEADGLPALIPINARTSLFNFDYVRLGNSTQPLIATLKNVMDPETRRCASELNLGIGATDFHDRFILLGNGFGDCDRTVNSREGEFIFADTVPRRLRQELHDLYDPDYSRFARDLDRESRIMFVIWRPESPRNDSLCAA